VSIGELEAARGPIRWLLDEPRGYTEGKTDPNGWLKQGKLRIKSFDEAIQEFMGRGAVSRSVFDQMARAAKSNAFTAAKLATEQARKVAQDAIGEVMQSGGSLRDFRKILRTHVETSGLDSSYVENVYRTNVAGAYSKGRVAHMTQPAVLKAFPYWQVVTVNDGPPRQRPTHQHVHGWCMRADDPGWQTSGIPPWGYCCRCRVIARSAKWVEKNGPTIWSGPLPSLPDPGFESHPPPSVAAQEVEQYAKPAAPGSAQVAPVAPAAPAQKPVIPQPDFEPVTVLPGSKSKGFAIPEPTQKLPFEVGSQVKRYESTWTHEESANVLSALEDVHAKAWLNKHPIEHMTIGVPHPTRADVGGWYNQATGRLGVSAIPPEIRQKLKPGIFSVAESARTEDEAAKMVFAHEWGHHIFMNLDEAKMDVVIPFVRQTWNGRTPNWISNYAGTDPDEYFAESYVAHQYRPTYLKRRDPDGYAMVEKVLALYKKATGG
jgi:SPP1 gp7 family putative phage head morphogenesis protein